MWMKKAHLRGLKNHRVKSKSSSKYNLTISHLSLGPQPPVNQFKVMLILVAYCESPSWLTCYIFSHCNLKPYRHSDKANKKHAIRDSSSHPGVKAPPIWFPARAEFLAGKKRAGTIEASLYIN